MDKQLEEIVKHLHPTQAKRLLIILAKMDLEQFPLNLSDFQDLLINA